jgi:hypothetical protein
MLGLAAVRTLRALRQRQPHAPPSHRPLTIAAAAIVWLLIGLILYFVAWPWLWSDPIGRLLGYLRTGVDRTPIRVLYFGQIHLDRDVPWHYPWLYTLTTVPTAVGLVGLWGAVRILVRRPRDPFALASLGAILLWLGLFSTRVPVYDGERLFLPVFALASILIGHTCAHILTRFTARPKLRLLAWAVLALQVAPLLHMHPYEFSYYNELVGGLPGAERLGLELTTWTDVVDPGLLDELAQNAAPDEVSALVPTLAPQQGLLMTTRLQARRRVLLADQEARANATWVILHRREAYWPPDIELLTRTPAVQLRSRSGVWLSGLWRTRPSASNRPSP